LTCCANANSVNNPNNTINTLGNVDNNTLVRVNDNYPTDFFKPKNFAYYGDYALFGSSDRPPLYSMQKDNDIIQQYEETDKLIIASDHLPVISTINLSTSGLGSIPEDYEIGGGRRKTIRRNKKTHKRMRKHTRMTRKRRSHSRKYSRK